MAYFVKIKENQLKPNKLKKIANKVLNSLMFTHQIVLNIENHQIPNN